MELINIIGEKKGDKSDMFDHMENGLRVILQRYCRGQEGLARHANTAKQMRKLGNY